MLGQAHSKFIAQQQKKVAENKEKQKELMKWLDWACSDPDVKNVWIKNKINNKFYNIKGEEECLLPPQ